MKMKYFVKIAGLFVILVAVIFNAKSQHVHKWEVYPIVFTTNGQYSNPYADIPVHKPDDLLKVTFTGIIRQQVNQHHKDKLKVAEKFSLPHLVCTPECWNTVTGCCMLLKIGIRNL
jgi:hypothetical protein